MVHYWPGQERLARALLPVGSDLAFPGLPADLLARGESVDVFLAPDAARWDSITGGRAPDWGAGVAIPSRGIVVLPGYVSDRAAVQALPGILRHELAHIALHRFLEGAAIPRWFDEGYAMWSAGQFDADAGWQLRLAFLSRRAPPLDSLTLDWPLLAADARLAYLLSGSAVRYLYTMGPPRSFGRLLDEWRETRSFETALRSVYIVSSPQFERLWRDHVRRQYGWLQILAQSAFIWVILTLLVVALFLIRRRRDRRRLAALRAAELPDQPAYWLESPDTEPGGREGNAADAGGEQREAGRGQAQAQPEERLRGDGSSPRGAGTDSSTA